MRAQTHGQCPAQHLRHSQPLVSTGGARWQATARLQVSHNKKFRSGASSTCDESRLPVELESLQDVVATQPCVHWVTLLHLPAGVTHRLAISPSIAEQQINAVVMAMTASSGRHWQAHRMPSAAIHGQKVAVKLL
jgi:hypothetical protein